MSGVDERVEREEAKIASGLLADYAEQGGLLSEAADFHRAIILDALEKLEQRADDAEKALREIRDDFGISIIDGHRVISADAWHIARTALAAAVVSAEPTEEQG